MLKKNVAVTAAVVGAIALLSLPALTTAAKSKPVQVANDGRAKCYDCHDEVKALKEGSKHAKLSCKVCHDKLDAHMSDPEKNKPVTVIDQSLCGKCHKEQYESFFEVNYEASARKEKGTPTGRSPMQDKLLAGHGFTFEHAEPRGHAFMVIDQFAVDRFQGGRFQFKKGWQGVTSTGKTWDVLTDTGKKLPETAMAGNPTCIQCKTSDHLLKWKFMGDKDPKAKWDRTSNIVDVAKDTNNPLGCVHCHDPHGTQPRVVRDALIQAIEKDPKGNIFAKNGATDLKVIDFRGFRKIGIMQKTDSRMMCAQCHVEYNCNAGTQWSDAKPVKYDDLRTNHFPLKNSLQLLKHYQDLNFFDFKHAITGARLIKFQHPEAETYAGSVHDKAGVQCHQCHMPQQKAKNGKKFSTHGVIRPKNHVKEACLGCHPKDSVAKKSYEIDAAQNYVKGKMRKAEYWLGQLIDTYAAAQRLGVAPTVLDEARAKHEEAHVLWEYWTAENSDGFHNPELARESLAGSIAASKAGVKILNDAMTVAKKDEPKK
ncbi:ammonia-forming cytochrome c nitrite reductase subunit c552 [Geomonas subterranea]|uniref:Ammonia-forming cytochrome c nitrite reductase subunit c552 n=1 Tax=Geomonas subterranea TaxID=2847989 RepID=A0ABX8LQ76_9BACT|nr:ammonia-forming cytochrome c nitrite reductase subunit c552 [Geomonas subterranea]QXE92744.1 ammonia-forming cytochrome c nitrite reductase subunit c552 [Geomonas subterranea]QXM09155.1 ammonia-forming cytochrome c nitrite reductase subunit c552 [Geomonas subterranea]